LLSLQDNYAAQIQYDIRKDASLSNWTIVLSNVNHFSSVVSQLKTWLYGL